MIQGPLVLHEDKLLVSHLTPSPVLRRKTYLGSGGARHRSEFVFLQLFHNCISTKGNLAKRGIGLDTCCLLCSVDDETSDHLFLNCVAVTSMWRGFSKFLGASRIVKAEEMLVAWAFWAAAAFWAKTPLAFVSILPSSSTTLSSRLILGKALVNTFYSSQVASSRGRPNHSTRTSLTMSGLDLLTNKTFCNPSFHIPSQVIPVKQLSDGFKSLSYPTMSPCQGSMKELENFVFEDVIIIIRDDYPAFKEQNTIHHRGGKPLGSANKAVKSCNRRWTGVTSVSSFSGASTGAAEVKRLWLEGCEGDSGRRPLDPLLTENPNLLLIREGLGFE
ncbi:Reverse transcriptase zinc-binding domain [Senna tora]|uniref:Reverse transcriptase zinc-binding domain n=1 Tax=Senna tora TaxID=362788 RepID=A0A834SRF6_9FABA|nr:Reverse transcriptase zinc-binding domain [Senna tora]